MSSQKSTATNKSERRECLIMTHIVIMSDLATVHFFRCCPLNGRLTLIQEDLKNIPIDNVGAQLSSAFSMIQSTYLSVLHTPTLKVKSSATNPCSIASMHRTSSVMSVLPCLGHHRPQPVLTRHITKGKQAQKQLS